MRPGFNLRSWCVRTHMCVCVEGEGGSRNSKMFAMGRLHPDVTPTYPFTYKLLPKWCTCQIHKTKNYPPFSKSHKISCKPYSHFYLCIANLCQQCSVCCTHSINLQMFGPVFRPFKIFYYPFIYYECKRAMPLGRIPPPPPPLQRC